MHRPAFWLAVGKIIWINVLLSGDNALVIAMACRGLHGRHRLWAWCSAPPSRCSQDCIYRHRRDADGAAIFEAGRRTCAAGHRRQARGAGGRGYEIAAGTTLWHAVRIVVIADIVMSLDT